MAPEDQDQDRIFALMPRIDRRAVILSRRHDLDLDDIRSEMLLAILERAHEEPDFLAQTDSYIVQYGEWKALHVAERQHTYERYCPLFPEDADELIPQHTPSPEQAIIAAELAEERAARSQAVREVVSNLTGSIRTVAEGLMTGRRRKDIAQDLGVRAQTLSHYYRRLAVALAT